MATSKQKHAYRLQIQSTCIVLKYNADESSTFEDWQGYTPSNCRVEDGIRKLSVINPISKKTANDQTDSAKDTDSAENLIWDYSELKKDFKLLGKDIVNVTHSAMKTLALKHDDVSGFWMIHCKNPKQGDQLWRRLVTSLLEGMLPNIDVLSISAQDDREENPYPQRSACIFACTKDFTDEKDVFDAEKLLRNHVTTLDMYYKADIYSHVGIYANGPYLIRPSIYKTEGKRATWRQEQKHQEVDEDPHDEKKNSNDARYNL